MSERHRTIAAAPVRAAHEAWELIADLAIRSLEKSPSIGRAAVQDALSALSRVGPLLVAGGHLERHPLVVAAAPLHLSISTASGAKALDLEEHLNPVPGAATATDWTIYVPAPPPLSSWVEGAVSDYAHLSTAAPPAPSQAMRSASKATTAEGLIDLDAFRHHSDRESR